MRRPATKIIWTCPECTRETEVLVGEFTYAKLSGPPESCYPAEGGEIEPERCPFCKREIDVDEANDRAEEQSSWRGE